MKIENEMFYRLTATSQQKTRRTENKCSRYSVSARVVASHWSSTYNSRATTHSQHANTVGYNGD